MILSAGFGTRLKPLTDNLPKALVPYKNTPLIVLQIERLKSAGADEIVVNAHHFHQMIRDFFSKNDFGIKVNVIVEEEILGTGGGIINARRFFENESEFIVINVDVDTNVNLNSLINSHKNSNCAIATLCVQKRKTSRYLEFDENMHLLGRENESSNKNNLFAFNGLHIVSGSLFDKQLPKGFSDIINDYIELIKIDGNFVSGYDAKGCYFKDLGKIENL